MWPVTSAYGFPLVEEVKDIAGLLVMDPEDGPQRFHLPLSLVRFCLSCRENTGVCFVVESRLVCTEHGIVLSLGI